MRIERNGCRPQRGAHVGRTLVAVSTLLVVLGTVGGCRARRPLGTVDVPGRAHVLAMTVAGDTVFLGVAENPAGEVHVIDASIPDAPVLTDSIEVGGAVRAMRAVGGRLYLATSAATREVLVLDAATHAELGSFDLPGTRGAIGIVVIRRKGKVTVVAYTAEDPNGPERFTVDATRPERMTLVDESDGRVGRRPPVPMGAYDAGGPVVARARGAANPALTLLAVDAPDAEFQIVADLDDPLSIADVNGDGVVRLACLGDSNTAETIRRLSWCGLARREIWNHTLELRSRFARDGARMVPPPGNKIPGAGAQLAAAIADGADHVILAFGTNDTKTPAQVIADKAVELERVAAAAGIGMWVALVPPRGPNVATGEIEAMNAALRAAFDPAALVDFYTGFTFDDMTPDRVHFTPAGQAKRAHVVAERLKRTT